MYTFLYRFVQESLMLKSLLRCIVLTLLITIQSIFGINVIFDLHNVLVITNKKAALTHLPKKDLALYLMIFRQSPQVSFYKILHTIKPLEYSLTPSDNPTDEHGNPLPQLMIDWLSGALEPEEIIFLITQACNQHPEWFAYTCEKNIVLALSNLIFSPKQICAIHALHPHAAALVKKCKAAGHSVYVLSNWDQQSFLILRQKFADFFNLFDGIGISGAMKSAKPSAAIYQQLLTTHQLNPEECWFIDDQLVNITSAQKLGINTIMCSKKKGWLSSLPDLISVWQDLSHRSL